VHPSLSQDFWFTGDEKCVPGGPAFDYTYYNTYTAVVGAFTGWLGIVVFQATMSGWSFRTLFWVTTVIQVNLAHECARAHTHTHTQKKRYKTHQLLRPNAQPGIHNIQSNAQPGIHTVQSNAQPGIHTVHAYGPSRMFF